MSGYEQTEDLITQSEGVPAKRTRQRQSSKQQHAVCAVDAVLSRFTSRAHQRNE
jgi:hypothetical protein